MDSLLRYLLPFRIVGWAAFAGFVYGPLAAALWDGRTGTSQDMLTLGRLELLASSLLLSVGVAVLAMTMGTAAALWLGRFGAGVMQRWAMPLVASVVIPPTDYALAWNEVFSYLGGGLPGGVWPLAAMAQTFAYLPFATGLALMALSGTDAELLETANLYRSPGAVLSRIVLPLARPALTGAAALIFLLSLLDYTIPSIFGVNVYALEIFIAFSASHRSADALLLAAPLVACATLLAISAVSGLRHLSQKPGGEQITVLVNCLPFTARVLLMLAASATCFALAAPVLGFLPSLFDPIYLAQTVGRAGAEIGYSLSTGLMSSLLALLVALVPALELSSRRPRLLWLILLLPVVMPPALHGVGLIAMWNPVGWPAYGTPWMTVVGNVARSAPIAAVLLAVALHTIDSGLVEAALVCGRDWCAITGRVLLPLMAPALALVAGLTFALALGEIGTAVMVMPPGYGTLTVKTYNYLHYGGTRAAAGLCLIQFALAAVGIGLPALFAMRRRARWPA